eukprot:m.104764 g.104764  ORF g.104764 m.104764 type:complete len:60 (+) comp27593_c0_seq2:1262-1441(+)
MWCEPDVRQSPSFGGLSIIFLLMSQIFRQKSILKLTLEIEQTSTCSYELAATCTVYEYE